MSLDQESLFSLELVVDKICVPKITCRFPAVAFRLLNFPALMIYHLEPDVAVTVKQKIVRDVGYKPPPQLHELQDKDGNFVVKKGKSCLFKVSPNILQSLLTTTPLYVMLIDAYPETPRLIGNCTVPLDATMDDVYDDICKSGISVPSVHGHMDTCRLFNLMSTDIGSISLGFRLLSLGVGLLPHIPDSAITKVSAPVPKAKQIATDIDLEQQVVPPEHAILHAFETQDKNLQVAIAEPLVKRENIMIQTEKPTSVSMNTQTRFTKSKAVKKAKQKTDEDVDDVVVTNVYCPPTLFYNSQAPEKSDVEMEFYSDVPDAKGTLKDVTDDEYSSDDDTIRPEDRFSDTEREEEQKVKEHFESLEKSTVKRSEFKPQTVINQHHNLTGLPILNGLLKEILMLQGLKTDAVVPHTMEESHKTISQKLYKALCEEKKREGFLTRMATPRSVVPKHKDPQEKYILPQETTQNKGWLGQNKSLTSSGKSTLLPGMTLTQRLRLAKINPELLRKQEMQENIRKAQRGSRKPLSDLSQDRSLSRNKFASETKVIGRDPFAGVPLLALDKNDTSQQHKKPVPTPRQSSTKEKTAPVITPRASKEKSHHAHDPLSSCSDLHIKSPSREKIVLLPGDDFNFEDISDYSQSSLVEVHAPMVTTHSSYSSNYTESDIEKDVPQYQEGERLPTSDQESRGDGDMVVKDLDEYSEDFEDVALTNRSKGPAKTQPSELSNTGLDAGEVLGLRMVVDKYSDDDSPHDKDDAHSFVSANSQFSEEEVKKAQNPKLKLQSYLPNPRSSAQSPAAVSKHLTHLGSTREPITINSTTTVDEAESYEADSFPAHPHPSPRKSKERIHTESISSYSPSEIENVSPVSLDEQQILGESFFKEQSKYIRGKPRATGKLGHTWSGI